MKEFRDIQTGAGFDLAENWGEVTFGQWLAIATFENATSRFHLEVLASDVKALQEFAAGTLPELYETIAFVKEELKVPTLRSAKPIGDIIPPKDVGLCTTMQYWCVEEWLQQLIDEDGYPANELTWYRPLLAIYLYPSITGKTFTDLEQIAEIESRIDALPCTEAVPLARFFFRSFKKLRRSGSIISSTKSPGLLKKNSRWQWFLNWLTSRSIRRLLAWPNRRG